MWAFTATIYIYTIPLILIACFNAKGNTRKIYLKLLAASNAVLIFYSLWLIGFYSEIILWIFQMPSQVTKQAWQRNNSIDILIINILRILLPILFMRKKYAFNKWFTMLMWVLLNYYNILNFGNWLIGNAAYNICDDFYIPYAWLNKVAFYCSGLIFFYSMFELSNKKILKSGAKG